MTKSLNLTSDWLNALLPEGYPYPSSTIISGPGGSGKPLIGLAIVRDWLKGGGNVVFIPLQYPDMEFVGRAFEKLYGLNIEEYDERIAYVKFNPEIEEWERKGEKQLEANLVRPEVWEDVLDQSRKTVEENEMGTMFFGSAINLLLFSPTYRNKILNKLVSIIRKRQDESFLFAVSTSAYKEKIRELEKLADNLMLTKMEKPMELEIEIARMTGVDFLEGTRNVPIPKELLEEIKEIAEETRNRAIPKIKNI